MFALATIAFFTGADGVSMAASTSAAIFFADETTNTPAPSRKISKAGDTVTVWVDDCDATDVAFKEVQRSSRFAEDLGKILKTEIGGLSVAPCIRGTRTKYTSKPLVNERGTVTATANDSTGNEVGSMTITTGPTEHLFLSLDLPVNSKGVLKYDSTTGTLQPTSASPQLYWAIDYQKGDVVDPSTLTGLDGLSIKILMQASSKPLDSFGAGLGYVLPKIGLLNLDLSSFSVFVGHFWTKQDRLVNGNVDVNGAYAGTWRVGISYSLDDALKWVKKQ
jgi:hypothetical protein